MPTLRLPAAPASAPAPIRAAAVARRASAPAVAIAAAVAGLALAACGAPEPDVVVDPPTPVEVVRAESAVVATPVTAVGRWGPRDEALLSFKTGGVVAAVLVDEGARVRRGQVLARLDLREIDALVAKAEAAYEKADRDAARLRRLFADSVVTLAQRQDAETARRAAAADLEAARVNREYAVITAPADGIVLERRLDAGGLAAPGAPVFRFGDLRRGSTFRGGVADRDAVRLAVGDSASVTFDALPGRRFAGRLVLLGASADPRTGTYTVEVALDGADRLPAGLVGRATVHPRAGDDATLVPVEALLEVDDGEATLYALDEGADAPRAVRRTVQVDGLHGARAAVRGVPAGARVVTAGAAYLRDGAPVLVTSRDSLVRVYGAATDSEDVP